MVPAPHRFFFPCHCDTTWHQRAMRPRATPGHRNRRAVSGRTDVAAQHPRARTGITRRSPGRPRPECRQHRRHQHQEPSSTTGPDNGEKTTNTPQSAACRQNPAVLNRHRHKAVLRGHLRHAEPDAHDHCGRFQRSVSNSLGEVAARYELSGGPKRSTASIQQSCAEAGKRQNGCAETTRDLRGFREDLPALGPGPGQAVGPSRTPSSKYSRRVCIRRPRAVPIRGCA